MKLHGEEIKVGDKVWSFTRGWGVVTGITEGDIYPIEADLGGKRFYFTEEGKAENKFISPTLFWDEIKYTLPKKKVKAYKLVLQDTRSPSHYLVSTGYHTSVEEYNRTNSHYLAVCIIEDSMIEQ